MPDVATETVQSATHSLSLLGGLLASNPYFSTRFGLIGLGAGLAITHRGLLQSVSLLQRQLLVSREILSHYYSRSWFLHWMAKHQSNTSNMISQPHYLVVKIIFKQYENGITITTFELSIPKLK